MNFFEIMKYFARAIEQMRAVDGILIPQFPWPYANMLAIVRHFYVKRSTTQCQGSPNFCALLIFDKKKVLEPILINKLVLLSVL